MYHKIKRNQNNPHCCELHDLRFKFRCFNIISRILIVVGVSLVNIVTVGVFYNPITDNATFLTEIRYNIIHLWQVNFSLSLYIYIYIYSALFLYCGIKSIYLYIYIIIIIMSLAWISLTLSRHFSLSFIASSRSSGLHPVSSHSCWIYARAGRPDFARSYEGVYRSTSFMSSSLFLQQCPACLVRLTCIVFVMGGKWPYSWCLVGCCRQDLFYFARSILV